MKKNFRKVMSVFLAMAIMLCTMSIMASAATFKFVYDKMGDEEIGEYYSVLITGYEGTAPSKLVIPDKIEGLPVESVEPMAFMSNTNIQEVVLPESLLWVEEFAFAKCSNLAKVTIPASLGYIAENAFYNCKKLKTVTYNGYQKNYDYLYIEGGNDALWNNDWNWTHYNKDYDCSYREYSLTYKTQQYITPDYNLKSGESIIWWSDDGLNNDGSLYVDEEGWSDAYNRGTTTVYYEVLNRNGDVVFHGEDCVTVKYNFFQWIIEYILFGWAWGF
ncbi:MAG: leucine-rich repeat domain-containing protein [Clostridia bacterium]|nr:leucine-rich repeat domain-containing protein [Clostridia bacterium]